MDARPQHDVERDRADEAALLERLDRRMDKDVDRIAFFSDAVFAIAITLLTVRIQIPSGTTDLDKALADNGPSYFSFALSFWVIGSFWMAHHRAFRFIARFDRMLIRADLLLLAAIAFLPYPTDVVGRYGDRTAAVVLYAATIVACGLALTLLWLVAERRSLLEPDLPAALAADLRWRGLWLTLPFLISIPVAFFDPFAATLVWVLLVVVRPVERRVLRRRLGDLADRV